MRRTVRTASSILLALPLAVGVTAPALAAPAVKYRNAGSHAEANGVILGDFDLSRGNVHAVSVVAENTDEGSWGYGFIESFTCDDGITDPYEWGEDGEALCSPENSIMLDAADSVLVHDKKLTTASMAGDFTALAWQCEDEDCWPVEVGQVSVDLAISATGKKKSFKATEVFKDRESGDSYRGTNKQTWRDGVVRGTVAGSELVDSTGILGTFTFKSLERTKG